MTWFDKIRLEFHRSNGMILAEMGGPRYLYFKLRSSARLEPRPSERNFNHSTLPALSSPLQIPLHPIHPSLLVHLLVAFSTRGEQRMPKIVSSSIVSTSEQRPQSRQPPLSTYYCICGDYLLILDKRIQQLPRRKTDGAHILQNNERRYKVNAVGPTTKLIKRQGGFERQYRYSCPKCLLPFLYETDSAKRRSGLYSYVLHGALRDEKGRDPDETDASTVLVNLSDEAKEALMRAKEAMLAGAAAEEEDDFEVYSDDDEEDKDEADLGGVRWRKEDLGGREVTEYKVGSSLSICVPGFDCVS